MYGLYGDPYTGRIINNIDCATSSDSSDVALCDKDDVDSTCLTKDSAGALCYCEPCMLPACLLAA